MGHDAVLKQQPRCVALFPLRSTATTSFHEFNEEAPKRIPKPGLSTRWKFAPLASTVKYTATATYNNDHRSGKVSG